MAAHGAWRLGRMNVNLSVILGVEALCAAQGIGFRAPLRTFAGREAAMATLRAVSPQLLEDRYLAPDIEAAARLVRDGALAQAARFDFLI
jgi:histidine ammonia-lyase